MTVTPYVGGRTLRFYWPLLADVFSSSAGGVATRAFLTFAAELLWFAASSALVTFLSASLEGEQINALTGVIRTSGLALGCSATFYLMNLYDLELVTPRRFLLINLTQTIGVLYVAIGLAALHPGSLPFVPGLLFIQVTVTAAVVVCARMVIDAIVSRRHALARVAFIGGADATTVIEQQSDKFVRLGFKIERLASGIGAFGRENWPDGIARLVIDDDELEKPEGPELVERCRSHRVRVERLSAFRERVLGKVSPRSSLAHELTSDESPRSDLIRRLLRVQDVVVASAILLFTLPLSVVIAAAVKCESRGPALFRQERVGRHGRLFTMYKFRSMYESAVVLNGPAWMTHARDPRVTRVGGFLRVCHLDELPQLINVLKGEMSLVGPRPFHPAHFAQLKNQPYLWLRQLVPPGVTGWAQIRCDYSAAVDDFQEVLERDLYFIKHASPLLNLLIIVDTLRTCLWRRGAR